jgi:hypothetical protein
LLTSGLEILGEIELSGSQREVTSRRKDKNPLNSLSVVRAEVLEVAVKKVRCTSADCSERYGPIFIGQLYVREERVIRRGSGGNDLNGAKQIL